MRKEDLSIDTTFDPCQFSLDSIFRPLKPVLLNLNDAGPLIYQKDTQQANTLKQYGTYWQYYIWPTIIFAGQGL